MKAKTLLAVLVFLSLSQISLFAQTVDSSIVKKFSPSIVTQVYNVVSKTKIGVPKQKAIANYLQTQDSTVAAMIKKGSSSTTIDSMRRQTNAGLLNFLSPQEKFDYTHNKKTGKPIQLPQLTTAVTFKDSLGLTNKQVDSLLANIDNIKNSYKNAITPFNVKAVESSCIAKILTANQYNKLLKLKNRDKAQKIADKKWDALEKKGLSAGYNENATTKDIANYYLDRQAAFDKYAYDKNIQKQNVKLVDANKPKALKLISKMGSGFDSTDTKQKNSNSQLLVAIKNKNQLNLTNAQTDSLIAKSDAIKKARNNWALQDSTKSFDQKGYESAALNQILSENQYSQTLALKNQTKAQKAAERKWRQLEEKGLTAGLNKVNTIQEVANYYFAKQTTSDRYAYDKTKQKQELKKINANQPAALKLYDQNDSTISKSNTSQLSVAIKNKAQLNLSDAQVNSLKAASANIKTAQRNHALTDSLHPFNKKALESAALNQTLSESQYTQALTLKNQEKSRKAAERTWQQLDEKELSDGLNETTIKQELANFYFTKQTTSDRYAYDKAKQKQMLKEVNATEPTVLKLLRRNDTATNISRSNTSQLSIAIKSKAKLNLSQVQVDSLIAASANLRSAQRGHSQRDSVHSFDRKGYESAVLNRILTTAQYDQLMIIKNKAKAQETAEIKWSLLEQNGLTANRDKSTSIQQMSKYYFDKQSASDQYAYDKEKQKQNLKLVNNDKPEIMKAVNALGRLKDTAQQGERSSYSTSQLTVALRNKEKLNLSSTQIDSLTAVSTSLKAAQRTHNILDSMTPFAKKAYESQALNRLLTPAQYTQLLEIKNRQKAQQTAQLKWAELEQKGLAGKYTQSSTVQEFANYFFARQSALDLYAYDKALQSTHIKQVNAGKPTALKALEHAKRNPNNNTIGQGFEW